MAADPTKHGEAQTIPTLKTTHPKKVGASLLPAKEGRIDPMSLVWLLRLGRRKRRGPVSSVMVVGALVGRVRVRRRGCQPPAVAGGDRWRGGTRRQRGTAAAISENEGKKRREGKTRISEDNTRALDFPAHATS
jgi:hypothetical protein